MGHGRKGPLNQSHIKPQIHESEKERKLLRTGIGPQGEKTQIVLDRDTVNLMKKNWTPHRFRYFIVRLN